MARAKSPSPLKLSPAAWLLFSLALYGAAGAEEERIRPQPGSVESAAPPAVPEKAAADAGPPLDLERVVIRGQAARAPLVAAPSSSPGGDPGQIKPSAGGRGAEWNDHLETWAGNFESWEVRNIFHFRKRSNSLAVNAAKEATQGFRQGYAGSHERAQLEYQWLAPRRPAFSFAYSALRNDFELPEPQALFFRQHERDELAHDFKLKCDGDWPLSGRFETHFEYRDARQADSARAPFNADLLRTGFIYSLQSWNAAFSLEREHRGGSRLLLSRLFVQNTRHPLDERTALHWGLGAYVFDHENDFLQQHRFLLIRNQDLDHNRVALSPFLLVEHEVAKPIHIYASFSQFMESTDFLETSFMRPELSQPSDFVSPSRHVRYEFGLRWELKDWQLSASGVISRYRNRPVMVEDASADNGKITPDIWGSGRSESLLLQATGPLGRHFSIQGGGEFKTSEWANPTADFTPYDSGRRWFTALQASAGRYSSRLGYDYNGPQRGYPSNHKIPSSSSFSLAARCRLAEQISLGLDVHNLLDHSNMILENYPAPPRSFLLGLLFRI